MALQLCRECAARISTEAPSCPHCGVPDPTRGSAPEARAADGDAPIPATSRAEDPGDAGWYYLASDRQQGPHTRGELLKLLHSGEILPETRVKSGSMQYWMPVKTVPELGGGGPTGEPSRLRPGTVRRAAGGGLRAEPARRTPAGDERERSARLVANVGYGLQAAGFLTGVSLFVAVGVAYARRDDVEGTWLHSHFQWQINTFWYLMLWVAGSLFLAMVLQLSTVGFGVLWFPSAIWFIYRVVHGWLRLNDGDRV
jgi:uncharacterized membrane protein